VLVDVDGTLVDSNYLTALAWFRAFREHGHTVPMTRLHRLIGMGAGQLIESVIGEADDRIEQAHGRHYAPLRREITRLPGARELLVGLADRGLTVVLATSAKPEELETLLRVVDADDAIEHVVSADDVERSKPEPDIFATALRAAQVPAERAMAIGDTVWDVQAAARCALRCICVTSGGISAPELLDAGAAAVYADASELLDHLDASPLAELFR
jgi:HAD superfamily hydrolase (TIGR01509 family)